MKAVIFGATGGIGRHLVEQALEQQHDVTAFAGNPAKVETKHPNLKIARGDVIKLSTVENAVQGQDAVLVALCNGRKGKIRAAGTKNIITQSLLHRKASYLTCFWNFTKIQIILS